MNVRRNSRMNRFPGAGVAALVFLAGTGTAHAYLDPGTGSAILQGVLGALAAAVVVGKLYWHRLLRLLGLKRGEAPGTGQATGAEAGDDRS